MNDMARTKHEILERLREIAERELETLPDTLAAMEPKDRAAAAIKLASLTLEGGDIYSNEHPGGIWRALPERK